MSQDEPEESSSVMASPENWTKCQKENIGNLLFRQESLQSELNEVNNKLKESNRETQIKDGTYLSNLLKGNKYLQEIPIYKCNSKDIPKGLALIINNVHFDDRNDRSGSDIDKDNMEKLLQHFGYHVDVKENQTIKEMEKIITEFAAKDEHKDADSTVVVLLSYGRQNCVMGKDGELMKVDFFTTSLNPDKCPLLAHKPKIFIIQASRDNHLHGNDELPKFEMINTFPLGADYIIVNSTTDGGSSYRNETYGSIFILSVCKVFSQYATNKHIGDLIYKVNEEMTRKTSNTVYKQNSEKTDTLLGPFYFFRTAIQPAYKCNPENMDKGLALIINNVNFDWDVRKGSDIDCDNMKNLLEHFGYHVDVEKDRTKEEMEKIIKEFAAKDKHKYADSAVVVLLSHGQQGGVMGIDGKVMKVDFLRKSLNSDECPLLMNKPKIFIIQACRNKPRITLRDWIRKLTHWFGTMLYQVFTTTFGQFDQIDQLHESSRQQAENIPPNDADYLIANSTTDGNPSFRFDEVGSRFILFLCEKFAIHAPHMHIDNMLLKVNAGTAAASDPDHKQISENSNMLRKDFYFLRTPLQQDVLDI